jgi:hypothetical protein
MATSITVEVTNAQWAWSDPKEPVVLEGGVHELANPSAGLVKALAQAEAAQAGVRIVKASEQHRKQARAAVESDVESLKHNAKATAIRHELLEDRDKELDAAPQSEHPRILEEFEKRVDKETRKRLGESR